VLGPVELRRQEDFVTVDDAVPFRAFGRKCHMTRLAWRLLFGDPAKALGLVFGIAFATLLITQQGALFVGLMLRTQGLIEDAQEVDLWVMDPAVEYLDASQSMRDIELQRVRGVNGVKWAVPMFKTTTPLKTPEGRINNALLIGFDDASLIGATQRFLVGSVEDLRRPDAVAIDRYGFVKLWPGEPIAVGKVLELNDRRAKIVAITDAAAAFALQVILYARYSQAVSYAPTGRHQMSFILARADERDARTTAQRITVETGLKARSSTDFSEMTIDYYLRNTGIPVNFGVVIAIGIIVGAAVVGLTMNMFVNDNMRIFGVLKAIGVTNSQIVGMLLTQCAIAAIIGFGIGIGLTAAFFTFAATPTSDLRGFFLPWWVAVGGLFLIVTVVLVASMRRVLWVDPAIVFRG
jgi:putative ABC transport system permease protein